MSVYEKQVAVVGGGAAGLCAAIAAADLGAQVVLYERGARVGKKLLATGNGRCNLTNRHCAVAHYHGADPAFVRSALAVHPVAETLRFFDSLGVMTVEAEEGKVYPRALQASAVLDALRWETERLGVETRCACEITSVTAASRGGFTLRDATGARYNADGVVIAAGGAASAPLGGCDSGYGLLRQLGHDITALWPSIVQLKTDTTTTKPLNGIKVDATVTLVYGQKPQATLTGEILFTDYGLSGPPIMQLSCLATRLLAQGKGTVAIVLDVVPELSLGALTKLLHARAAAHAETTLENFLGGMLNKRLGQTALKAAGIAPLSRLAATLSPRELSALAAQLKGWSVAVRDTNGLRQAQVTAGGARTAQFDPQTMQSLLVPGLYACGEVLDIDGDCGGFNLQWAWSSGRLAGAQAAQN